MDFLFGLIESIVVVQMKLVEAEMVHVGMVHVEMVHVEMVIQLERVLVDHF